METTQEHFLTGEMNLEMASSGKRFANYLIDYVTFLAGIFAVVILVQVFIDPTFLVYEDTGLNSLLDRIISLIIYGAFMGVLEGFCKGKTLGKLITGTRAVNEDGSPLTFQTALFRGLCRAIPFNGLSALGSPCHPWHDKWTKTFVIDEKKSVLPEQ